MKKYYYCLSVLMACSSLMTNAMEEQKPSEKAMQELRLILSEGIKHLRYLQSNDRTREDEACLGGVRLLTADQQNGAHISVLPTDLFLYHIIPHLDGYALLRGVALTCHYFNRLSKMSCFTLTDNSLSLAHTVPLPLLRLKMECESAGFLKAAQSPYVNCDLLVRVLGAGLLKPRVVELLSDMPTTLDGCVANFDHAYPRLKLAYAIAQLDNEKTKHLSPLFAELKIHPAPRGMFLSGNKLRLLSLHPQRPGIYNEVIEELMARCSLFDELECLSLQKKDAIGRDLIWEGRQVEYISSLNFEGNPLTRQLAGHLLEWCFDNNQLGSFRPDSSRLFMAVGNFGRPDLARKILLKLLSLPNTLEFVKQKVEAVSQFKIFGGDVYEALGSSLINQLCEDIYGVFPEEKDSSIWIKLSPTERLNVLSFMMRNVAKRAQVQLEVDIVLTELRVGTLKVSDVVNLLTDLMKYNFPEEVSKLVSYILGLNFENNFADLEYCFPFILEHAIQIDRKNSIAFLSKIVNLPNTSMTSKLQALSILSQHALADVESYVVTHVDEISARVVKNEIDIDDYHLGYLCRIYDHMGHTGNRDFYFKKWVEKSKMCIPDNALMKFQEAGFQIERLEDLVRCDPIKVLDFANKKFIG